METLKQRLLQKKQVLGSWITLANPSIPEVMATAEFDFLVVDLEHSAIGLESAAILVSQIEARGIAPLVRVGENNPNLIKRVMDTGAHGVIVPMINSRQDAEKAVQSAKYPPAGKRGVGLTRAQGYGFSFEAYKKWAARESIVIGIIEHIDAIRNIEDILSVKGLDATMIGPYDLSGSLGFPGEFEKPQVKQAIGCYEKACRGMKKPMGLHIVQPDTKKVAEYQKRGYTFLPIGLDTLYLGLKCQETMKEIRRKK